jgi:hypothetical protein
VWACWQVTSNASFVARAYFGAVSYGDLILVVGGATYAPTLRLSDVWSSRDGGASWTLVCVLPPSSSPATSTLLLLPLPSTHPCTSFALTAFEAARKILHDGD